MGLVRIQLGGETYNIEDGLWSLLLPPLLDLTWFIPLHGSDAQPLRTFVGDCFVDGIMDGEFVTDSKNDVIPTYLV
jgi:hypothetical protein